MRSKFFGIFGVLCVCIMLMGAENSCGDNPAVSTSGVNKASVKVTAGSDGLTTEQRNVADRVAQDNKPGAVQHLYVISPYSGQVILYSTVKGKVSSGNKRLSPSTVNDSSSFRVEFKDQQTSTFTHEVLGDDGTYGTSGDYIYWWDVQGRYHQHFLTGGQIIHTSSEPLSIKSVIISTESVKQ